MKQPALQRMGGNGRRSSCVAANGLLYTSALTTVNLEADTAGQTLDILSQLDKLMDANNTHRNNIVNATIYLQTMEDYGVFNSVWDEWINDGSEPARCVVGAQLALEEYKVKIALVVALPQ